MSKENKTSDKQQNGNDFIADVGISNMMQEVTAKMAQDINTQKELVIKQKLKEIVGIEIDLQEELQRRFKRFCTVRQGSEETIYFNDGSIEGERIVTFVKKDIPFDAENFYGALTDNTVGLSVGHVDGGGLSELVKAEGEIPFLANSFSFSKTVSSF